MTIQAFLKVMPSSMNTGEDIIYYLEDKRYHPLTQGSLQDVEKYVKDNNISNSKVIKVVLDDDEVMIMVEVVKKKEEKRFCIDCEKINYCKEAVKLDQEACKHFKRRK